MRHCLKEITGRIEFAVEFKGKTAKDIRMRMDDVMAARGEGLVVKHPLSKYVLNGRNMDWIKVGIILVDMPRLIYYMTGQT
jgi:DNA ligase-4